MPVRTELPNSSFSRSNSDGGLVAGRQEVDLQNERLKVLSPCPGQLPGRFLLAGEVKWLETN